MKIPTTLQSLIAAARAPLNDWPSRYPEHRALGYLCSYAPQELIHAAGWTPVRIRANRASLRYVDAHLQSFTCALCRSALDQTLGNELDWLGGTLFSHTCDAMQALADLWRMHTPSTHFVDAVMQPVNLGSPAARPYLVAELERVRRQLGAFSGHPISDDDLWPSIDLYRQTAEAISQLGDLRSRLSAAHFFAVLDAAQVMPREQFNPALKTLLAELESQPSLGDGPRLYLTGAVLDEIRLLDLIDDVGARVVGDDLCSGSRHFFACPSTDGNPLEALADCYLQRPPCPTKLAPAHDAARTLMEQASRAGADGILFVLAKFCEPHAFEYARILPQLRQAGIPCQLLEMEHTPSLEALRTRLQAFVEML